MTWVWPRKKNEIRKDKSSPDWVPITSTPGQSGESRGRLEEDVDGIFLQEQQPATRNMFLQDQSAMRTQTFGGRSFGRSPWGIRADSKAFESR